MIELALDKQTTKTNNNQIKDDVYHCLNQTPYIRYVLVAHIPIFSFSSCISAAAVFICLRIAILIHCQCLFRERVKKYN